MPKKYFTSKIVKLVLVVIVCLVLIFTNPKGIFDPVRGFFLRLSIPFQRIFFDLSERSGELVFFLGSISELKTENAELVKENNALAAQLAKLEQEKKENVTLREQLDLLPKDKFDLVGSFVVGQDPQGSFGWVLIDKGEDVGIKSGMAAIVSGGILVGKVDEVYAHSAKVNFLLNATSSINALDLETSAKGIVRGEYGLGLVLDMVAQTDLLNVGDSIVTSGLGSEIPKGLLIGKVKEIQVSRDKLFQGAIITSRVKYANLDTIFIIKNQKVISN
jgi:rod shape-determining protein MreC